MEKQKAFSRAMILFILLGLGSLSHAQEVQPIGEPLEANHTLLGQRLSVQLMSQTVPSGQGISSVTETEMLGNYHSLVESSVEALEPAIPNSGEPPSGGIPLARTDLYIAGTRVWAGSLKFEKGSLTYSGGVAPMQVPFPLFTYPVGPLLLRVDAGIEFEGSIEASLTPGISYPLNDSTLDAKLQAKLYAAGFVEAYASLWFLRSGLGGRVNLVEGSAGVDARLFLGSRAPEGKTLGKAVLLNGNVYGFFDSKLLFGRWNRVFKKDFFRWNGLCYAFGEETCALN